MFVYRLGKEKLSGSRTKKIEQLLSRGLLLLYTESRCLK